MWSMILSLIAQPAQAQSFSGFQSPFINMVYTAVRWQEGRPTLGVGWSRRFPGQPFMTVEAELHFPLEEMWRFTDYQVIVGAYRPLVPKRASVGVGLHARLGRSEDEEGGRLRLGLAGTVVPFYVYAASLNDGPYGTVGARATYEAVLAERRWTSEGPATWKGLAAHRFELGGHVDVHLDRTISFTGNAFATHELGTGDAGSWEPEGDVYIGASYYLSRW